MFLCSFSPSVVFQCKGCFFFFVFFCEYFIHLSTVLPFTNTLRPLPSSLLLQSSPPPFASPPSVNNSDPFSIHISPFCWGCWLWSVFVVPQTSWIGLPVPWSVLFSCKSPTMQLSNYNDRLLKVTHASDENTLKPDKPSSVSITEVALMAKLNHLYRSWCAAFVCLLASSCLPSVYSPSQPLGVCMHAPHYSSLYGCQ